MRGGNAAVFGAPPVGAVVAWCADGPAPSATAAAGTLHRSRTAAMRFFAIGALWSGCGAAVMAWGTMRGGGVTQVTHPINGGDHAPNKQRHEER